MPLAERLRAYLDTPVEALWTLRGPEAAVPLLAPRIRDVYLEASARWPDDDVERVHDVRVATRRLRAALAAVAPLLRRGAEQRARARVQALGRTLGPRRAADVSQAWVSAARAATEDADEQAVLDRLFGLLALRRQRTTERLHAYFPVQVLIEDGLVVLEAAVHSSPDGPRLDVGIDAELRGRVREVTRQLPSMGTPHDDEGHHELRIALKRLRYTCELAQQAWPGRVPDGVLPGLKAMQGGARPAARSCRRDRTLGHAARAALGAAPRRGLDPGPDPRRARRVAGACAGGGRGRGRGRAPHPGHVARRCQGVGPATPA
jgi:CHAD domain-containing protein